LGLLGNIRVTVDFRFQMMVIKMVVVRYIYHCVTFTLILWSSPSPLYKVNLAYIIRSNIYYAYNNLSYYHIKYVDILAVWLEYKKKRWYSNTRCHLTRMDIFIVRNQIHMDIRVG
jgi:hypothetical protein